MLIYGRTKIRKILVASNLNRKLKFYGRKNNTIQAGKKDDN